MARITITTHRPFDASMAKKRHGHWHILPNQKIRVTVLDEFGNPLQPVQEFRVHRVEIR